MKILKKWLPVIIAVFLGIAGITFMVIASYGLANRRDLEAPSCPTTAAEAYALYGGLPDWDTYQGSDGAWNSALSGILTQNFVLDIPEGHNMVFGVPDNHGEYPTTYVVYGPAKVELLQKPTTIREQVLIITCQP